MAYVVMSPCVDDKYLDCVYVCPVDCFYDIGNMLIIDPETCIDCDACVAACPVEAIVAEDDVPDEEKEFIQIAIDHMANTDAETIEKEHMDEQRADEQIAERKAAGTYPGS